MFALLSTRQYSGVFFSFSVSLIAKRGAPASAREGQSGKGPSMLNLFLEKLNARCSLFWAQLCYICPHTQYHRTRDGSPDGPCPESGPALSRVPLKNVDPLSRFVVLSPCTYGSPVGAS